MTVSLESLRREHLDSPALQFLLPGLPPEAILPLETIGGIAQAILYDEITVGILTVTLQHEAMIAIHPDYQRKGIALASLVLAKSVAVRRGITWVIAKARIGRPSNGLLAKFGAVETSRKDDEVFYRVDFADA
ncbi:hypothetical protein [Pseudoxanthomonas sp. CF125]|uniref:hypothetical protein n=1 Tax=Pseudoxanthomonas sp. CF125 TaxID=1855303 RepID=UPI000B81A93C|nr:hypothetical protein [Pseudoxanthomonas sp. CF125]